MVQKNKKNEETPKIIVNDRRHWINEEDNEEIESVDASTLDERLPSYVEQLKKEAEEKDKRLREYIAAYKENSSQNDEVRQRLQRENETRLDQFKANLFARLVPILDNLKRAAASAKETSDLASLEQGIAMVINQFTRELEDNGVQTIPTDNRKFDPKTDEAFMTVETQDSEQDGMILEELEPGYIFKEKLIKAAKVKVARLKT